MSHNPIEALKKSDSRATLQSVPSLSNLYNSHSNRGSTSTLASGTINDSVVFNNGVGMVSKGTVTHTNNNKYTTSKLNSKSQPNTESNFNSSNLSPNLQYKFDSNQNNEEMAEHLHYYPPEYHQNDNKYEIHDEAFELNWKPQVSAANSFNKA